MKYLDLSTVDCASLSLKRAMQETTLTFATADQNVELGMFISFEDFRGRIVACSFKADASGATSYTAKSLANIAAAQPVKMIPMSDPIVGSFGQVANTETYKSRMKGVGVAGSLPLASVVETFANAMIDPARRLCGTSIPISLPQIDIGFNNIQMSAMTWDVLFSLIQDRLPTYRWRTTNGTGIEVFDLESQPTHRLKLCDVMGSTSLSLNLEQCCSKVVIEGKNIASVEGYVNRPHWSITQLPVPSFVNNDYIESAISFADQYGGEGCGTSLGLNTEHDVLMVALNALCSEGFVYIKGGQDSRLQIESSRSGSVLGRCGWDSTMVFIEDNLGKVTGSNYGAADKDDTDAMQLAADKYIDDLGVLQFSGSVVLANDNFGILPGHKIVITDHPKYADVVGFVTETQTNMAGKVTLSLGAPGSQYINKIKAEIAAAEYRRKIEAQQKVVNYEHQ